MTCALKQNKRAAAALLWGACVLFAALFLLFKLPAQSVTSDILDMLPSAGRSALPDHFTRQFENRIIFAIKGDKAAQTLLEELQKIPLIERIDGKISPVQIDRASGELFDHRIAFLSPATLQELSDPKVYARKVLAQVYAPFGSPSEKELASDPLLLTRNNLALAAPSGLTVDQEWLTLNRNQEKHRILFAEVRKGADYEKLSALTAALDGALTKASDSEKNAEVLMHGAPLYSAEASRHARDDFQSLGLISILALLILIRFAFRSFTPIFLCLLSVSTGAIFGILGVVLFFKTLHAVTLVMCISLIGLATDYTTYLAASRMKAPEAESPWQTVEILKPSLLHALLTTVLTYGVLLLAPFPGLKQLAVFTVFGLTGACLTVLFWIPYFLKNPPRRTSALERDVGAYTDLWKRKTAACKVILAVIALFCLFGFSRMEVSDDLSHLYAPSSELKSREEAVQNLLGRRLSQDRLVLSAADDEKLFEGLYELRKKLLKEDPQSPLLAYLPALLPLALQKEAVKTAEEALPAVKDVLNRAGISDIRTPSYKTLTAKDFLNSEIGKNFAPFYFDDGQKKFFALPLEGIKPGAQLLEGLPCAYEIVNKRAEIENLLSSFRKSISLLLLGAFALIVLSIRLKYGTRAALSAGVGLALSVACAVASLGVFGFVFNVFSVFAVVLVLGIGIDYHIFFMELSKNRSNSLFALAVAAASSVLSLGILVFSSTEGVQNFGLVLTFGVACAFLTAPLSWLFAKNA